MIRDVDGVFVYDDVVPKRHHPAALAENVVDHAVAFFAHLPDAPSAMPLRIAHERSMLGRHS